MLKMLCFASHESFTFSTQRSQPEIGSVPRSYTPLLCAKGPLLWLLQCYHSAAALWRCAQQELEQQDDFHSSAAQDCLQWQHTRVLPRRMQLERPCYCLEASHLLITLSSCLSIGARLLISALCKSLLANCTLEVVSSVHACYSCKEGQASRLSAQWVSTAVLCCHMLHICASLLPHDHDK
jgi:hypothetical protein